MLLTLLTPPAGHCCAGTGQVEHRQLCPRRPSAKLKERGFLDILWTKALIQDDIPSFAHVILFAPDTKSSIRAGHHPQSLITLLSSNTNLLIALSPKQSPFTSLAAEFSLILPPPGTPLVSHFPERSTNVTTIPIPVPPHPILTPQTAPIWLSGVPHAFGNNPLLFPILKAPAESFAADSTADSAADTLVEAAEKGGEGLWVGSALGVVTGFQTRDESRAMGIKSGNEQFAKDITAWTSQEKPILRIDSTAHHLLNETEPREHYTIKGQIVHDAYVSQYNAKTSAWEPYSGLTDLQLEFTMLDPHIRTALPAVPGVPGKYSVTFRAPDRHGVFKSVVDYKRHGWTFLASSTTVPVVPPRHDGHPRFLSAAWPYYAGAISTSVGFLLFSALWLAGDDRSAKKGGAKTE
ncbi:hypothetical protein HETIRDRAFT_443433 [Heterobasidion irregulare TC 32-1]|uniref:Dolichyl-diphosphooligosaccharide--protein glycosyltransferase subunit WBP1 n=1 Tax=Heterobasidion irregulare (strain TC 32-1) TaxID=747525 RepID=W4KH92_HETIT|nr:uncharacterized protein HETIRDRAFT_443433 [Heterobasidion irregulare TC 32-1]ETW85207.1 hypothetical protein HETIRDRAFT_443433 [Heterobasidion irregulare TC 32-1]